MPPLRERWSIFLGLLFDPWVIVLASVTVFLGWVLASQDETLVVTTLLLIISLFSGVIGAILIHRWSKEVENGSIEARGQVSVRGLKLLLRSIVALDRRVREYLIIQGIGQTNQEVVKICFEEIAGRCKSLEEETISAIENWTDIVPDANVKSQIGEITGLGEEIQELQAELETLRERYDESQDQSQQEKDTLKAQIQEKEAELRRVRSELRSRDSGLVFGSGTLTGERSQISLDTNLLTGVTFTICGRCGSMTASSELACSKCGTPFSFSPE